MRGGLAQLGERSVRNAEAEGSIPLPSTILWSRRITMRLKEEKIDSLSRQILNVLRSIPDITFKEKDIRIFLEIKKIITEDLKREEAIDEEVRILLEKYRERISTKDLDYQYLFRRAKAQLMKERGLIM